MARVSDSVVGQCPNCRSYDLVLVQAVDTSGLSLVVEPLTTDWPIPGVADGSGPH